MDNGVTRASDREFSHSRACLDLSCCSQSWLADGWSAWDVLPMDYVLLAVLADTEEMVVQAVVQSFWSVDVLVC
jgi:hypothetical protein